MVHASNLAHLSIIGRYAYALTCVESLCAAWTVDDPFVSGEVEAHWQATEIRLACHWFDKHPFPRYVEDFAARLRPGELAADRVQSLYHALGEARMVMCGSCYAAASDSDSMQSLLNVVGILARWGIEVPELERFRLAHWVGEFGWGASLSRSSFTSGAKPA